MSKERTGWVDTNVILRFLLNDHKEHSLCARVLFEQAEQGEVSLKVTNHVVCEVVYILEQLGYSRDVIFIAVTDFSAIQGLKFDDVESLRVALTYYKETNVDFSDALLYSVALSKGEMVFTFNKNHFRRLGNRWEEPGPQAT
jgi:predicted nucleic-acid-binding protein